MSDRKFFEDLPFIEPVHVDGVLGVFNMGTDFMTCYFRWRPALLASGQIGTEKVLAHVIVRPMTSILYRDGPMAKQLAGQRLPAEVMRVLHS